MTSSSQGRRATTDAEVVAPGAAAWRDALRRLPHDFYQLPEYVAFATRWHDVGEPRALIARHGSFELLLPMIVRPLPPDLVDGEPGGYDATSPRGFPGLIAAASRDVSAAAVRETVAAGLTALRQAGIVTVFNRLHPLLLPDDGVLAAAGSVVDHGESISIDLSVDDDDWHHGLRGDHRRNIARASRLGYVARVDETWTQFDRFIQIYGESMRRVGAAGFWHFGPDYFADLRATLGTSVFLAVAELDGDLAAGALLTEVGGIVEYHLVATADRHVAASPSKLVVQFARGWAKERGNRCLHLGGSVEPGGSLHYFKLGFSRRTHPVRTLRIVADAERYAHLIGRHDRVHGPSATDLELFFPRYRMASR